MNRKNDNICRSFRQDFPQFVAKAEALDVKISLGNGRRNGRERVFWLDGYRQMTGYTTKKDGSPFTLNDAAANVEKILREIEEDRAIMAEMTAAERFARVMTEMRKMKPFSRMIGEVRLPGGDRAHVWFMADMDGGVCLLGIGDVAKAKSHWQTGEGQSAQFARFCDSLEVDFQARVAPREIGGGNG